MFCNHSGCNETVKLPNKYCSKHTPFEQEIKASDLTLKESESVNALKDTTHLDVLEKANKSMNTKKTTK